MADQSKTVLFEETPVPEAVMKLAVPTMISSLVMVIYNSNFPHRFGVLNLDKSIL